MDSEMREAGQDQRHPCAGRISIQVDLSQQLQCSIASLWDSQKYVDVTFVVEDTRVMAHRLILAAQSNYFDRLLFGEMREAHTGAVVPLEDTPAESFQLLLKFAYTGKLKMDDTSLNDILELVTLADRFRFTHLKAAIATLLEDHVSDDTVLQLLVHADLHGLQQLHQKCLHYCDEHATAVLKSESFPYAPECSLKLVLSRDTLDVAELSIFKALLQWKEHNQRSTEEMKELLGCVRLTRISPQELFEHIEPWHLFTGEQILTAVRFQSISQLHLNPRGKKSVDSNLFKTYFSHHPNVTYPVLRKGSIQPTLTISNRVMQLGRIQPARAPGGMPFIGGYQSPQLVSADLGESVTVSLDSPFLVNQLLLEGYPDSDSAGKKGFTYKVLISADKHKWVTLFDYSQFRCFSLQQLSFPTQLVRHVRFDLIDRSDTSEVFYLRFTSLSAMEDQQPFLFREKGVIAPLASITPNTTSSSRAEGEGLKSTILFHQPYSISSMKVCIDHPRAVRAYDVTIAVGMAEDNVQAVAELKEHATGVVSVIFQETAVSCVTVSITNILKRTPSSHLQQSQPSSRARPQAQAPTMGGGLQAPQPQAQPTQLRFGMQQAPQPQTQAFSGLERGWQAPPVHFRARAQPMFGGQQAPQPQAQSTGLGFGMQQAPQPWAWARKQPEAQASSTLQTQQQQLQPEVQAFGSVQAELDATAWRVVVVEVSNPETTT